MKKMEVNLDSGLDLIPSVFTDTWYSDESRITRWAIRSPKFSFAFEVDAKWIVSSHGVTDLRRERERERELLVETRKSGPPNLLTRASEGHLKAKKEDEDRQIYSGHFTRESTVNCDKNQSSQPVGGTK